MTGSAANTAPENRTNLLKKPPKGGMPARDSRKIAIASARNGLRFPSPFQPSSSSPMNRIEAAATTRNAPPFMSAWVNTWNKPPARPYEATSRERGSLWIARPPTTIAMRM